MAITREAFGTLSNGEQVDKITIVGKGGLSASFITYGATLTNLIYNGTDVVLGYDDLHGYQTGGGSIGVTVGRYANRIAGGTFELNGVTYDVGRNEKDRTHLHGGAEGFQVKNWEVESAGESAVRFSYCSPDGEMGYPGMLNITVLVALTEDNSLVLTYDATTDQDTVVNFTNHAYFNLNGYDGGTVEDTLLSIAADHILAIDDTLIPTGERMSVAGTPFDFRELKPIGRDIDADHEQVRRGGGFDHNFILGETPEWRLAATAISERSGIRMECYTDQPGVQLYTANFLDTPFGKGGPMVKHQGFCLETQHFPDSPHHSDFPTTVLKAGDTFHSVTAYRFRNV